MYYIVDIIREKSSCQNFVAENALMISSNKNELLLSVAISTPRHRKLSRSSWLFCNNFSLLLSIYFGGSLFLNSLNSREIIVRFGALPQNLCHSLRLCCYCFAGINLLRVVVRSHRLLHIKRSLIGRRTPCSMAAASSFVWSAEITHFVAIALVPWSSKKTALAIISTRTQTYYACTT